MKQASVKTLVVVTPLNEAVAVIGRQKLLHEKIFKNCIIQVYEVENE